MTDTAVHPGRPADDQATRLRALVDAMERRHSAAPQAGAPARGLPRRTRKAKVVTFSSGKGGVGKTNTCVNAAIALAQLGRRVVVVDADLGMANADVLCGITPTRRLEHFVGVSDLSVAGRPRTPHEAAALAGRTLCDLAIDAPGGFRLIPGAVGIARMAELSPREQARLVAGLADLDREADLILIDTGAGLGREVISFLSTADLAVIVTTPEPTAIADAYALMKCLANRKSLSGHSLGAHDTGFDTSRLRLVVNQVRDDEEAAGVHKRIAGVCERFLGMRPALMGWIAQDPRVGAAVRKRTPVMLDSPKAAACRDIRGLADAIGRSIGPEPRVSAERPGWFGRLTRTILRGS
jgi:flagellar biosynthesis protein FlhG